jgi:hypothetical protein
MGKEDQHRLERTRVVFGFWSASVRAVQWLRKAADAEQAGAGVALHSRGAVGDFDSPGQGRAGEGRAGIPP